MKKPRTRTVVLYGGVIAAAVALAGVTELFDSDSPPVSGPPSAEEIDDYNAQRIAAASPETYYRTLAEKFDLPRSEMDYVLHDAGPGVCHWYYEGYEEMAVGEVLSLMHTYPSDYTREYMKTDEYSYVYDVDRLAYQDAVMFVNNTLLDYCPYLGY